MLYQDRFDPTLKITFNGDEYTCSRRKVYKLDFLTKEWQEIKFTEIKKNDTIRLKDPDDAWVYHEDGRNSFKALSDMYIDELGLMCFNV